MSMPFPPPIPITGLSQVPDVEIDKDDWAVIVNRQNQTQGPLGSTGKALVQGFTDWAVPKDGRTVTDLGAYEANNAVVNPLDFGAVGDGVTDDSAALTYAAQKAKELDVPVTSRPGQKYYVNGQWHFDASIDGGTFIYGPDADVQMLIEDPEAYRFVRGRFENASGNDLKQCLIARSGNIAERRGSVSLAVQMIGFLNGAYGQYLKTFILEDTCYAYSRNTVPGRFQEGHFVCITTDLFICKAAVSDGSVVGFASGSGVIQELYLGPTAMNSYDHGFYSSSPTEKELTVFDNCKSLDAGGDGIKCYSNGDLYVISPMVKNSGKNGITPVANRAYINGGVVLDPIGAVVHQQGKTAGAGVNEFELLSISGLQSSGGLDDGVRVNGPDVLSRIEVNDCNISVARRAYIKATNTVNDETVIDGGRLHSGSATESVISCLTTGTAQFTIRGGAVISTGTNSNNMIDLNVPDVRLLGCEFEFIQVLRAVRNRYSAGSTIANATSSLSGTVTGAQLILQDGGTVTSYVNRLSTAGVAFREFTASAIPVSGTYARGSIVWNTTPTSSGILCWVCITAGTPGTWQAVYINQQVPVNPTGTASLTFAEIAAGDAGEQTITVTGAATGDAVLLGPPAALSADLVATGYVSATNAVTVRLANPTGSPITPTASQTWRATVLKP